MPQIRFENVVKRFEGRVSEALAAVELSAAADRVLMLKDGHVVEVSEPSAFVKSANPDVREFLDAQLITPDFLERNKL